MLYLGYFVFHSSPFWNWSEKYQLNNSTPPIQIAGPVVFFVGVILTVLGLFLAISSSQVILFFYTQIFFFV